jgi:N-formylglutamate amidohydrolase
VVANFSRKYIDANREEADAYDVPAAKPAYDAYHGALAKARGAILKRWGTGILLDLHGQGTRKDVVYRGTSNLQTIKHLIEKHTLSALTGSDGLLGVFAAKGNTLIPSNEATEAKEHPSFNGGWIVRHYGSKEGGMFDAVQFEFGANFRRSEGLTKAAQDLAEAVAAFAKKYLPPPKS